MKGVAGQALMEKNLVAGFHHTGIVDINVLYEKPGADTVVGQPAAVVFQSRCIVFQQTAGLFMRVCARTAGTSSPKMNISIVFNSGQPLRKRAGSNLRLQVNP